ncbi:hypothetical protein C8J56DRAFT_895105 [Mycena floridula]|nr:hypothetical protein C8J56DRAFT_895105 [Mycena floridula]
MNHNNVYHYATCDVPAPNKLPLISEGILTLSVLVSAIKAVCNYCELKGIKDEDAVKQALSCFKGEDPKGWIKKQRVVLVSLSLEEFFDRIGTRFLPVNWELDIIQERNNIQQGENTFDSFAARVESLNSLLEGTGAHMDDDRLIELLTMGMHPALLDEVLEKNIQETDINKWTAAVRKADSSLRRKLSLFKASMSKCFAVSQFEQ